MKVLKEQMLSVLLLNILWDKMLFSAENGASLYKYNYEF